MKQQFTEQDEKWLKNLSAEEILRFASGTGTRCRSRVELSAAAGILPCPGTCKAYSDCLSVEPAEWIARRNAKTKGL